MAIFTEAFINEFFGFGNKKKKENNKSTTSSQKVLKPESYDWKRINVNSPSKATFEHLEEYKVLTAEGFRIDGDESFKLISDYFVDSSAFKSTSKITIPIYVIKGKVMNDYYHLTGENAYTNDLTIVCIDWASANCKTPYKGQWRYFDDVVYNNSIREKNSGNPYYTEDK